MIAVCVCVCVWWSMIKCETNVTINFTNKLAWNICTLSIETDLDVMRFWDAAAVKHIYKQHINTGTCCCARDDFSVSWKTRIQWNLRNILFCFLSFYCCLCTRNNNRFWETLHRSKNNPCLLFSHSLWFGDENKFANSLFIIN